jgi:hypothetical protein
MAMSQKFVKIRFIELEKHAAQLRVGFLDS